MDQTAVELFFDIDGAPLGGEEGWLETECSLLCIRLGLVDIEGSMIGRRLGALLSGDKLVGSRDNFFDILGKSLRNEEG